VVRRLKVICTAHTYTQNSTHTHAGRGGLMVSADLELSGVDTRILNAPRGAGCQANLTLVLRKPFW
jgi:hypothetical protein